MTPENDPMPEIPAFRRTEDKEKKGSGLPLLGRGSGGKPILKIRGLGAGTTLIERLKQFSRKDVAFILSGLGVLFLAPLAEHFILGPADRENVLQRGFDNKGNFFSEANPYEPGTGGMSPGGLPGQGADVITPLNVRDPAALVMGPGATQQPPPPAAPAAGGDKGGWKDALEEAGRAGARRGLDSGGLPSPKGNLSSQLRGLSALSGGGAGGPSWSLAAPSAANVPNRAKEGRSLARVQAAPGYKGVGERGISSGGNADALKAAAAGQAGLFNREGGAASGLEEAARAGIPGGGGAGWGEGGPHGGGGWNPPGGSPGKDGKSLGESLAFMRKKMEMQKEIELKWKKKEWREWGWKQKIMESGIDNLVGKGLMEPFGSCVGSAVKGEGWCGGENQNWVCGLKGGEVKVYTPAQYKTCTTGIQTGDAQHPTTILDPIKFCGPAQIKDNCMNAGDGKKGGVVATTQEVPNVLVHLDSAQKGKNLAKTFCENPLHQDFCKTVQPENFYQQLEKALEKIKESVGIQTSVSRSIQEALSSLGSGSDDDGTGINARLLDLAAGTQDGVDAAVRAALTPQCPAGAPLPCTQTQILEAHGVNEGFRNSILERARLLQNELNGVDKKIKGAEGLLDEASKALGGSGGGAGEYISAADKQWSAIDGDMKKDEDIQKFSDNMLLDFKGARELLGSSFQKLIEGKELMAGMQEEIPQILPRSQKGLDLFSGRSEAVSARNMVSALEDIITAAGVNKLGAQQQEAFLAVANEDKGTAISVGSTIAEFKARTEAYSRKLSDVQGGASLTSAVSTAGATQTP